MIRREIFVFFLCVFSAFSEKQRGKLDVLRLSKSSA
jgi:hypothetical protein